MAHQKKKIGAQLVEDEEYQLRYERVAGIDVAKGKADVCTRLPPARDGGRRVSRTEEVAATVTAILALAARLLADGVELVSMESTSDYWRVWFYVLEAAGLNVQLVNSSHARQLAGRPKTDRLDAQWLARLTEMGLLRPSFVPPAEIRVLRDLTRTRLQLVHDRTREWQRLEKLLEGALVKLSSALSSLARVKSARVILEALAGGERDPRVLAGLAAGQVRAGRAGIEQALEGMPCQDHHGRLTRIHLDHITFPAVRRRDRGRHRRGPGRHPRRAGHRRRRARSPDPGPGAALSPAAERLAAIPGVSLDLARAIIAETGLDMTGSPPPPTSSAGPGSPRSPASPAPATASRERDTATPTCAATAPRPPPAPQRPIPSSANGSAACPGASAAAGPGAPPALHPRHHLAPPRRSRSPLHRPRPRLARPQDRHRPQNPQPPEPAPRPPPRQRHHHHTRRLNPKPPTRPATRTATGP